MNGQSATHAPAGPRQTFRTRKESSSCHRLAALGSCVAEHGRHGKAPADSGLTVTEVSDYTGFPEIMAGRVKTLHPRIHGGLLGRAGTDDAVMSEQDIPRIALAVINLYPFEG
jgi:phosphoribosylaminoimidazolecarboxamide formyltransferase/IMP cyclohydrolase